MSKAPAYLQLAQAGACAVATVQLEELLYSMDVEAIHRQLEDYLSATPGTTLILDLQHVRAVSSELIGAVLMLQRQAREGRGALRLCGLDERVLHIFQLSRVDTTLDLYPDVDTALAVTPDNARDTTE